VPRVHKAGDLHNTGRIRPLGQELAAVRGRHDAEEDRQETKLEGQGPQIGSHPPQASADSLERVQRVLHETVASFGKQRAQLLEHLQPVIVKLVLAVARRIVDRELRTDGEAVKRVVHRALEDLGRSGRIIARASPEDADILRDAMDQDRWTAPSMVELEVVADPSISRGGCILQSDYGQVDATVETQMAEMGLLLTNGED